jgi:hypothetical protein
MNERRWERLGAAAGIAFVVLAMIAVFAPGKAPDQDATGRQLMSYISGHRDGLRWAVVFWSLSTVAGLFFIATLRARLSEAEGGHSELATAAVVGGLFAFAANWIGGLLMMTVVYRQGIAVDAGMVRGLYDASMLSGTMANIGVAVAAGSIAAVVLSTGLLPRWVGGMAAAVGVLCVASLFGVMADTGAFAPGGAFQIVAMMAGFAMVLIVSVEFMVHAEAPSAAPTTAAMTA